MRVFQFLGEILEISQILTLLELLVYMLKPKAGYRRVAKYDIEWLFLQFTIFNKAGQGDHIEFCPLLLLVVRHIRLLSSQGMGLCATHKGPTE